MSCVRKAHLTPKSPARKDPVICLEVDHQHQSESDFEMLVCCERPPALESQSLNHRTPGKSPPLLTVVKYHPLFEVCSAYTCELSAISGHRCTPNQNPGLAAQGSGKIKQHMEESYLTGDPSAQLSEPRPAFTTLSRWLNPFLLSFPVCRLGLTPPPDF